MPTVELPAAYRSHPGDSQPIHLDGSTVKEVLERLVASRPHLRPQLFTPLGKIRGSVAVYVNEEDFRNRERESTRLKDRDRLRLVPSLAGG
jgi:sulfur-carrier protein